MSFTRVSAGTPADVSGDGTLTNTKVIPAAGTYNQPAGEDLFLYIKWEGTNNAVQSVTDVAGNTYVARTRANQSTNGESCQFFECLSCLGNASNALTVTLSGGATANFWALQLLRFTHSGGSASFVAEATPAGSNGSTATTAAFTAGTLALSAVAEFSGSATTAGTGWTESLDDTGTGAHAFYRVDNPGGTITANCTFGGAVDWIITGMSYTDAGGGGGGGSTDYITSRRGINGPGKTPNLAMAFTIRQRPQASPPPLSFSYTATGGIQFAGTSAVAKVRTKTGAGGVQFGGTAAQARVHVVAASGGITFGGAAAFAKGKTVTAAGGIQLAGTATEIRVRVASASGGVLFGGAATVSFSGTQQYSYTATGGMVLGGTASKAAARAVLASSGLQFGGAATVSSHEATRTVTPSGGLIFGGTANAQFFVFGQSGGNSALLRRRRL